jgi:X-X-X-Leu-X-X-Gly heptad repeat protein
MWDPHVWAFFNLENGQFHLLPAPSSLPCAGKLGPGLGKLDSGAGELDHGASELAHRTGELCAARANGGGPTSCAWREHRRRSGEQLRSVGRSYRAPGRSVVPACRALRRRRREGRKPPAPARRGGCAGRPPSALAGREVGEACTSQPRGSSTPPVTPLGELAPASLMATRELRAVAWVAGWLALLLLTRGAGAGGIREGERCRGRGVPLPGG